MKAVLATKSAKKNLIQESESFGLIGSNSEKKIQGSRKTDYHPQKKTGVNRRKTNWWRIAVVVEGRLRDA